MKRMRIFVCLLVCLSSTLLFAGGTQTGVTSWGLDRVDQRAGMDGTYTSEYAGDDVIIYVVDEGVADLTEFGGRIIARRISNFAPAHGTFVPSHGTKVASIAAGATYGVAKQAKIVDVRAMRSDGHPSTECRTPEDAPVNCVVDALDWIRNEHTTRWPNIKGVVNLSLTMGIGIQGVEPYITALRDAGLVVVAAATNGGAGACSSVPATY